MKMYEERAVLTSQFAVRELQKQLRRVMQTDLDRSANLGPFSLNVCVTVSHSITR